MTIDNWESRVMNPGAQTYTSSVRLLYTSEPQQQVSKYGNTKLGHWALRKQWSKVDDTICTFSGSCEEHVCPKSILLRALAEKSVQKDKHLRWNFFHYLTLKEVTTFFFSNRRHVHWKSGEFGSCSSGGIPIHSQCFLQPGNVDFIRIHRLPMELVSSLQPCKLGVVIFCEEVKTRPGCILRYPGIWQSELSTSEGKITNYNSQTFQLQIFRGRIALRGTFARMHARSWERRLQG